MSDERGLRLEEVTVLLGGKALFRPLTLSIAPGEVVSVMGPSGSGKSSLLNFLCAALPPGLEGRGRLRLDGEDLEGLPLERRGESRVRAEPAGARARRTQGANPGGLE